MVNEQDKFKAITEEVRWRKMSCVSIQFFLPSWMPPSLRCLDTNLLANNNNYGTESSNAWLPYLLYSRVPVVVQ